MVGTLSNDQIAEIVRNLFGEYISGRMSSVEFSNRLPAVVEAVVNTEEEQKKLEIIVDEDNVIFTSDITDNQARQLIDSGLTAV